MSAPVDVLAVLRGMRDPNNEFHAEAISAVSDLIKSLEDAHYCGLMIGQDCAWALAKLQREGIYKPACSDGRPSNADASRDLEQITRCRETTRAALARVGGAK